jgi:transcription elongation factor GreA
MTAVKLSKKIHDLLVKHISDVEEGTAKSKIPAATSERNEYSVLDQLYLKKVKELIGSSATEEKRRSHRSDCHNRVQCGSHRYSYRRSHHIQGRKPSVFELEGNDVTFLSPIGKALLLKSIGDKVEINIPDGNIHYEIRSIKFDFESVLTK